MWCVGGQNVLQQMSKKGERGGGASAILRRLNSDDDPKWKWFTLCVVVAHTSPAPATAQAQVPDTPTGAYDNKSMAIIMGIIVLVFFISGFLSLYTRHCAHRRTSMRGRPDLALAIGATRPTPHTHPRGLDWEVIHTFPTFPYSTVKAFKIGRGALACAVCLNEYQDEETLRLIPRCSHVFHPDCINAWLASHTTCPVCRANLVPDPAEGDAPFVALQIPDPDPDGDGGTGGVSVSDNHNGGVGSPKVNLVNGRGTTTNENQDENGGGGPSRSRSRGFLMAILFARSHSAVHTDTSTNTVVPPGENLERFTLRLEEEGRQLLSSSSALKRTKSCVSFTGMSSGRRGYRTRSVGSTRGRSYLQNEERGEHWGFTWTPPFFTRNAFIHRSPNKTPLHLMDNIADEASSDSLNIPPT